MQGMTVKHPKLNSTDVSLSIGCNLMTVLAWLAKWWQQCPVLYAETLEGPEVSPPSQAWPPARPAGEAKDAKKQREGLEKTMPMASQENVTPNTDPSSLPAVAPPLSKSGSQPQQTLEEMTAWLDAQLAKASGLASIVFCALCESCAQRPLLCRVMHSTFVPHTNGPHHSITRK